MKLNVSRRVHYESGPNMTPLVDVMMVLLIFLMMAGSFGSTEHYLSSTIPMKQKGLGNVVLPPGFVPDEPIEIRVNSAPGTSGFRATSGLIETSDPRALAARLAILRQRLNDAGTPNSKIQIIIEPSRDARYEDLIAVYEAALNAKFEKVTFASAHD